MHGRCNQAEFHREWRPVLARIDLAAQVGFIAPAVMEEARLLFFDRTVDSSCFCVRIMPA